MGGAIQISKVGKMFGAYRALEPVDIDIASGEFVSIVGESGCGKTTLLKIVGGLIPPSEGSVAIRGVPVTGPSDAVGFVFQNAALLAWKTAVQNILLPLTVHGKATPDMRLRAHELLASVGLSSFEDRYPLQLSGGMQQRVSICRALIQDPPCLLLDEPFGALDALTREKMNVLFNELWQRTNKTVLFVTHSIQEAVFLSTRVLVMSARPGRIIDDIQIPFARSRAPGLMATKEFGSLADRIRSHFQDAHIE